MKTVTRPKTQWQVRPRQAGGFAVYDGTGKYRGRADTREEAARLSTTLQTTPRTWADAAGSHAAHVAGLGES